MYWKVFQMGWLCNHLLLMSVSTVFRMSVSSLSSRAQWGHGGVSRRCSSQTSVLVKSTILGVKEVGSWGINPLHICGGCHLRFVVVEFDCNRVTWLEQGQWAAGLASVIIVFMSSLAFGICCIYQQDAWPLGKELLFHESVADREKMAKCVSCLECERRKVERLEKNNEYSVREWAIHWKWKKKWKKNGQAFIHGTTLNGTKLANANGQRSLQYI